MSWRLAKSLITLRDQFDELAPNRRTDSDGTIGNEEHQVRASDHNPNEDGVVCALDITHDPAHGVDTYNIADQLRLTHDSRIKYIISNSRIAGGENYARRNGVRPWEWHHYSGSNPHDHHFHLSVDKPDYDKTYLWKFKLTSPSGEILPLDPILRRGSRGERVQYLQEILRIPADGIFGPQTDKAVRMFQTAHKLVADGIVGIYVWKALLSGGGVVTPIPVPAITPPKVFTQSGKGSWYSQYKGKYTWIDTGDEPNSNVLGVPDSAQGISFFDRATLGKWFEVRAPNGVVSIEQQTDIGPHPRTGREIDISAAAAERFGYSPRNFPTDEIFHWRQIDPPESVAELGPVSQAIKYHEVRVAMQ